MHAYVVEAFGPPSGIAFKEVAAPSPGNGQVRLRVRAAGASLLDALIAAGKYQVKPPFPFAPGAEVAGVVRGVGAGVEGFAAGDRVLAMLGWGAYATQAIARPQQVFRIPDSMPFEHAAAFTIVYQT